MQYGASARSKPGAVADQQHDRQRCREGEEHAKPHAQIQALPAIVHILPMLRGRDQVQVRRDADDTQAQTAARPCPHTVAARCQAASASSGALRLGIDGALCQMPGRANSQRSPGRRSQRPAAPPTHSVYSLWVQVSEPVPRCTSRVRRPSTHAFSRFLCSVAKSPAPGAGSA